MKTCPYCAQAIHDTEATCTRCGNQLSNKDVPPPAAPAPPARKTISTGVRWFIIGALPVMAIILWLTPADPYVAQPVGRSGGSPVDAMSALEQMEVAFIGSPSQREITQQLDRAMTLYGLAITEDSYPRAGSALVALRQRFPSLTEMQILDYMTVAGVPLSFPNATGLAAAFLAAER